MLPRHSSNRCADPRTGRRPGLAAVALILAVLSTAGCGLIAPSFKKPNLEVVDVRVLGGNLFQQNLLATFRIDNPNDRALPVKSLRADLSIAGEPVASGVTTKPFVVPAGGNTQFDMTIGANLASGLLKALKNVDRHGDEVAYSLAGTASIDLPFMRALPFHQDGSLSLRQFFASH